MNILAVYGSNYGQAQAVLKRVAAALEARGHSVTTFKGDAVPAGVAVEDFDAAVLAASVRMGKYQPYMLDFARRNAAALNGRPTAFVSVNGTREESLPDWREEADGYVRGFLEQTGLEPRWKARFAGKLAYRSYDLVTRWIMKRITRGRGGPTDTSRDYEFTGWDAVDRFAGELADGLGDAAVVGLAPETA
jgi:menaquinone-dependent protoporphyrinogen oxidase